MASTHSSHDGVNKPLGDQSAVDTTAFGLQNPDSMSTGEYFMREDMNERCGQMMAKIRRELSQIYDEKFEFIKKQNDDKSVIINRMQYETETLKATMVALRTDLNDKSQIIRSLQDETNELKKQQSSLIVRLEHKIEEDRKTTARTNMLTSEIDRIGKDTTSVLNGVKSQSQLISDIRIETENLKKHQIEGRAHVESLQEKIALMSTENEKTTFYTKKLAAEIATLKQERVTEEYVSDVRRDLERKIVIAERDVQAEVRNTCRDIMDSTRRFVTELKSDIDRLRKTSPMTTVPRPKDIKGLKRAGGPGNSETFVKEVGPLTPESGFSSMTTDSSSSFYIKSSDFNFREHDSNSKPVPEPIKPKDVEPTPEETKRKDMIKDCTFDVCLTSTKKHKPRLQTDQPITMTGYDKMERPCDSIDCQSGRYTTVAAGRFTFKVHASRRGEGSVDWFLCRDDGARELVGRTAKDGERSQETVKWKCDKGATVWVEAVRKSGDAEVVFCRFSGHFVA